MRVLRPRRRGQSAPLSEDEVERAAAGWGGDAYRAWDVGGKTLLVWRSEWDRAEDAREFEAGGPAPPRADARREARTSRARPSSRGRGGSWPSPASGDAVTIVSSDDPALLPVALKAVGSGS